MLRCGLLGKKLGHSYSPAIHSMLADYEYLLYEREPEELGTFMNTPELDGFNVTIPYKKDVIPYLCGMSEAAKKLGSVNTVIRTPDGWYGDNTDYYGFTYMLKKSGYDPVGKKAVVLGNGGVTPTVCAVLRDNGVDDITVISRSGEDNYENIAKHSAAKLIVNTTPVGMYPENLKAPLSLKVFDAPECVLDLIYNPFQTALMAEAEEMGIKSLSGISMLVSQAKYGCELFTGTTLPDSETERVLAEVVKVKRNIVLVGMPGSGKTTLGRALAEKLGREFIDTDDELVKTNGRSIPDIFANDGEAVFRKLETAEAVKAGKLSSKVIATGGGIVTVEENYRALAQNGVIIFIRRDLSQLASDGRPLMKTTTAEEMYKKRLPMYERFADASIECDGIVEHGVQRLMEAINEITCDKRT
nr:AAA family ATPase [Clostridia bacterium]